MSDGQKDLIFCLAIFLVGIIVGWRLYYLAHFYFSS